MPRSLYELTADALKLADALESAEGDFSKVEGLEQFFDQTAADTGEKLDAYLAVLHTLDMEEVRAKQERDQWEAKRKAREARIAFLKGRLRDHLEATKQSKVQTATGRVIALQAAGGKQGMEIDDDKAYDAYQGGPYYPAVEVAYRFNRDTVRTLLEQGDSLPFARLLPRGVSLRIR